MRHWASPGSDSREVQVCVSPSSDSRSSVSLPIMSHPDSATTNPYLDKGMGPGATPRTMLSVVVFYFTLIILGSRRISTLEVVE